MFWCNVGIVLAKNGTISGPCGDHFGIIHNGCADYPSTLYWFSCSGFLAPCHLLRALLRRSFCAARSAAHGPWGGPSGPMGPGGPSGPLAPHPTQAPALELRCIRFSSVRGLVSKCRGLLATEPQKAYCQAVRNISDTCFGYFWGHGLEMLKMSLLKPI